MDSCPRCKREYDGLSYHEGARPWRTSISPPLTLPPLNLSASAPEKDTIQSCKRCADTFRRDVSDGFFERTREGWNLFVDQSYHRQEAGAL